MKFLKEQDKGTVRDIDKNCKNKWAWKWTDEELVLKLKGQDIPYKLGDCIKKVDVEGSAWCIFCNERVNYGGRGKKQLKVHCDSNRHVSAAKARLNQTQLNCSGPKTVDKNQKESNSQSASKKVFSIFSKAKQPAKQQDTAQEKTLCASGQSVVQPSATQLKPIVPYSDRASNIEAMILAFVAEHALPVSLAEPITELIKEVSRDQHALNEVFKFVIFIFLLFF